MKIKTSLLLLLVAPALLLCSCSQGEEDGAEKVLLIGLDGAEWDVIRPLVDAGEMPNLARLMERGVHGNLRSLGPPLAKSPSIWTTIATGKSPQEHGITGFLVPGPGPRQGKLLTHNNRRVSALWNIASSVGKTAGVVGWLVTWPAEPVNGFVISDYLQYDASKGDNPRMHDQTYPPELAARIAPDVAMTESIPWSFVQRFLDAPLDTTSMTRLLEVLLTPIKSYVAADQSFARIGLELYREQRPDFFTVYLRGMDTMGHLYWNYGISQAVPEDTLNPDGLAYLKGAVKAYYRYVDGLIGPFIDAADRNTTILVVSDHGFRGGVGADGSVNRGVEMHKIDGVFVMAGCGVGKGAVEGATVYDIVPTVLVLLGLPPARDMPGKVLWPALTEAIPRDRYKDLIETYETGTRGDSASVASEVDDEVIERLKALGYIGD